MLIFGIVEFNNLSERCQLLLKIDNIDKDNDETVEKENEKENYGVWYGDSLDEDEEKRQKYGVYR